MRLMFDTMDAYDRADFDRVLTRNVPARLNTIYAYIDQGTAADHRSLRPPSILS